MLAALAHTARDLGIGLLIACVMFGLAVLMGKCIRHGEESPEFAPPREPRDAGDLDDWLAESDSFFDFGLWERPKSSVQMGRRAA